jgi:replicative DNA helicase
MGAGMTERVERMPPYSEEAERGVLGSVLGSISEGQKLLAMLRGRFGMTAAQFYVPAHAVIWEAMVGLADAQRPVDILTVTERLQTDGRLDQIGGTTTLDRLVDATPTAAHCEYYAEILCEKTLLRRMLSVAQETERACYSGAGAKEVLSEAVAGFNGIGNDAIVERRSNVEVFDGLLENWNRAHDVRTRGDEFLPGLRTPYRRWNEIMGGLQKGLHFFGGKSSAGKTSLVLNICNRLLMDGHGGLMIQLDDTHEDVIGRMVSMNAGVSLPALGHGFSKHEQLEKIKDEIRPAVAAMNLHVEEECRDVNEARAMARYHKGRHKIEWVVIDYVQVLDADGNARDDERVRLGKIAAACKRMWKELQLPVLVVSQTSKFKDAEDDGMRADMSDLFGASELFHAATSVFIVKQVRSKAERGAKLEPVEWPIDETGHTKKLATAGHVVKNKHGPRDCMVMFWALLKYFQFTETQWVHERGIWRQLTWQEEMERAGGLSGPASLGTTPGRARDGGPALPGRYAGAGGRGASPTEAAAADGFGEGAGAAEQAFSGFE